MTFIAWLALVAIIAGLGYGLFLIASAVSGARKNLQVSPKQQIISVKSWYGIRSERRRRRVRSQLPVSETGPAGADETYLWVTGLAPIRFWFLVIPAVVGVIAAVVLSIVSIGFFQNPWLWQYTNRDGVPDPINVGRLFGWLSGASAWLLCLLSLGYAVHIYLKWSGEYLALSNYSLVWIQIHPAFAFWMKNQLGLVELSDISHAGHDEGELSVFAKAYGYATVKIDTPGAGDDPVFNKVPFIPDGITRAQEINVQQSLAVRPSERSETEKVVKELKKIKHELRRGSSQPRRLIPDNQLSSAPTPEIEDVDEDGVVREG